MSVVRTSYALLLAVVLALPVFAPVASLRSPAARHSAPSDLGRTLSLAGNTVGLAAVAVLVAVPLGTLLALALERLSVPGRPVLRAAVLGGLFVPLPVYAVAWQAVLADWLPPLALEPGAVAWRAWSVGLLPAGWVHGLAAVPWVTWVVGVVLARTDRDLEDDALLASGPWTVLRRVVLPRAATAAAAGAGWVCVQTSTEIPVTDAMMVRTYAEEVYTRLVGWDGWAGAVLVTVPVWVAGVAGGLLGGWLVVRRLRDVSPTVSLPVPLILSPLVRWLAALFTWGVVGLFAGLPLTALVVKASGGGLLRQLTTVIRADGLVLLTSVLWAVVTGVVVATVARWACWLAVRSPAFGRFLFILCVLLFLTPGPLVGLGMKDVIGRLVDAEASVLSALGLKPTFPPVRSILYDQPSPVPVIWAVAVRLFPLACLILWPSVRAIPRELWDAVAVDGHGPAAEWRLVASPLTRQAFVRAATAVAALALGEVSASKLVAPSGYETYILRLFAQMHYGAESTVAALCLLQVATSSAFAVALGWLSTTSVSRRT